MNLIYDFRVAPNSFDIATFIANGYLYSRIKGKKIEKITLIQAAFRPEPSWGNKKIPYDYESRKVDTVAIALSRLIADRPSVCVYTSLSNLPQRSEYLGFPEGFDPAQIPINAYSTSSLLPCNEIHTNKLYDIARVAPHPFQAGDECVRDVKSKWGENFVTLTIRNSKLNSARNDSPDLIEKFRNPLKQYAAANGLRLVIIPDRENLDPEDPINKFNLDEIDIESSFSLSRRLALYSVAKMNVSPSTGPAILLVLSSYPYYIYGTLDESVPVMRESFFARKGPKLGLQRPWATDRQWTDWTPRGNFSPRDALVKVDQLLTNTL